MNEYDRLVKLAANSIEEVFPWEIEDSLDDYLLLDIREPYEFDFMHIRNSINVPRGILESACSWNHSYTVSQLAGGRDDNILVVCRTGKRSALAVKTMLDMGFKKVKSLKQGIKCWNDAEMETVDKNNNVVDIDVADAWLNAPLNNSQKHPE